jgi:hypothetical protein
MLPAMPLLDVMDFYGSWASWLPMCILATLIAVTIYALFIAFAKAFKMTELEHYAESEILQSVATALMAMCLIGGATIVSGAGSFVAGVLGSSSSYVTCGGTQMPVIAGTAASMTSNQSVASFQDMLSIVQCRLQEKATAIAEVQDAIVSGSATDFNLLNLQISFFGITVFMGSWLGSVFQETESIRIANNLATVLLIGLDAQSFLVLYVKNTMLTMFIPLGILLRSFQFTRGAGALFISLGIGLFFLFPVFFVLLDPGFVKVDAPPTVGNPEVLAQQLCYPTLSAAVSLVSTNSAASATESLTFTRISEQLSQAYIGLILQPLVALFLTLAFVRYMMTLLGGDPYMLMRMMTKVI